MLEIFEKEYMRLYRSLKICEWQNYFENDHHDLNQIDDKIYHLVKKFQGKIVANDRRSGVAQLIINRALVDKDKEITKIRNKIDAFTPYTQDIPKSLTALEKKSIIAKRMRNDVLRLMKLRNDKARNLRLVDYPDLVHRYDEIHEEKVFKLVQTYLNQHLDKAKLLVKKHNLTLENWFSQLDLISGQKVNYSSHVLMNQLSEALGYETDYIKIQTSTSSISGFASKLGEDDIRLMVHPINSYKHLSTFFHELGHAIYASQLEAEGLYQILPPSLDEVVAVIIEYLAPFILLTEEDQAVLNIVRTLEYTRCAISAQFERDLWKNPENGDLLYKKYYEQLGIAIPDVSIWTIDSFRSIDPVYIHHYVVGAICAIKLIDFLKAQYGRDYKAYGKWIKENILEKGRKMKITELLSSINL